MDIMEKYEDAVRLTPGFEFIIFRMGKYAKIISAIPQYCSCLAGKPLDSYSTYANEIFGIADNEYVNCPRMPVAFSGKNKNMLIIRSMERATGLYLAVISDKKSMDLRTFSENIAIGPVSMLKGNILAAGNDPDCVASKVYCGIDGAMREKLIRGLVSIQYGYEGGNCGRAMLMYAKILGEFVGCKTEIDADGKNLMTDMGYSIDMDIFSAVILLLFMMFWREEQRRMVTIRFEKIDGEYFVCLSGTLYEGSRLDGNNFERCSEICECRRIADRYNMIFDYSLCNDREMEIRFCPKRWEWSYYGIKNSDIFKC